MGKFVDKNCRLDNIATLGVDFGIRIITLDNKKIKIQIWDTVSST